VPARSGVFSPGKTRISPGKAGDQAGTGPGNRAITPVLEGKEENVQKKIGGGGMSGSKRGGGSQRKTLKPTLGSKQLWEEKGRQTVRPGERTRGKGERRKSNEPRAPLSQEWSLRGLKREQSSHGESSQISRLNALEEDYKA